MFKNADSSACLTGFLDQLEMLGTMDKWPLTIGPVNAQMNTFSHDPQSELPTFQGHLFYPVTVVFVAGGASVNVY